MLARRRIRAGGVVKGRYDVGEYENEAIELVEVDERDLFRRSEIFAANRLSEAIVRLYVAPVPAPEIVIVNPVTPQKISAEVTRFTVTPIRELTQEDAAKAGFLYLHQLHQALMDQPHIDSNVPVSIIEFRCEGDV